MLPVAGDIGEEALAANRIVGGVGVGFDGEEDRGLRGLRAHDEEDFAQALTGGKTGDVGAARPVVGHGERRGRGPGEAIAVAELRHRVQRAAQVVDLFDQAAAGAFVEDENIVVGSGIGTTTTQNGLEYGNFPYGTRVEDETISLRTPDVIRIHGIYETTETEGTPSAPTMDLSSINLSLIHI